MSDYEYGAPVEAEFAPARLEELVADEDGEALVLAGGEHEVDDETDEDGFATDSDVDEPHSRIREILETSNAWNTLMSDETVRPQVHYTEDGVEGDRRMAPELRGRLYLLATAILRSGENNLQLDAEHVGVFYVRELR